MLDLRNEAADFVMRVAPFIDQAGTEDETLGGEGGAVRQDGIESVRFVHETRDGDSHESPLPQTRP